MSKRTKNRSRSIFGSVIGTFRGCRQRFITEYLGLRSHEDRVGAASICTGRPRTPIPQQNMRRHSMRRIVSVSAVVLLFGLTPVVGMAAAVVQRPFVTPNPSITFVDGWWEQEHH